MKSKIKAAAPQWKEEVRKDTVEGWELRLPYLRIAIHHLVGMGPAWFMSCHMLDIDDHAIGEGPEQPDRLQGIAIEVVQKTIDQMTISLKTFIGGKVEVERQVGYNDIKKGMKFREVLMPEGKTPRLIKVLAAGIYQAECQILEGRGSARKDPVGQPVPVGVYNKHLSDPRKWKLER